MELFSKSKPAPPATPVSIPPIDTHPGFRAAMEQFADLRRQKEETEAAIRELELRNAAAPPRPQHEREAAAVADGASVTAVLKAEENEHAELIRRRYLLTDSLRLVEGRVNRELSLATAVVVESAAGRPSRWPATV